METCRVAEVDAQADLTILVDRAAAGEQVVITRDGQPVAELRSVSPVAKIASAGPRQRTPEAQEALRRLAEMRETLPPLGISSVEFLREMYSEPRD